MTNEDIVKCKDKTSMPDELANWVTANYKKVEGKPEGRWELCCRKGNDWKCGRFYIDTEQMIRRGPTFDEFYGSGIVD